MADKNRKIAPRLSNMIADERKSAPKILEEKGEIMIHCNGNSMDPIIHCAERIYLRKVNVYKVGDAVFCKVNGALQVHKISAIDDETKQYQISNNKGFVNGWVKQDAVYGLAWKIEDRILVSDEDIAKRMVV